MYVCMYVYICMYVCMYVRMYVGQGLLPVGYQEMENFGKLLKVCMQVGVNDAMYDRQCLTYLCMYVCMYVYIYVCMYVRYLQARYIGAAADFPLANITG